MSTPLELINLDLELLMLLVQVLELGVQRQQMPVDCPWGLLPFGFGKWQIPGWVCSVRGRDHHAYPWTSLWT